MLKRLNFSFFQPFLNPLPTKSSAKPILSPQDFEVCLVFWFCLFSRMFICSKSPTKNIRNFESFRRTRKKFWTELIFLRQCCTAQKGILFQILLSWVQFHSNTNFCWSRLYNFGFGWTLWYQGRCWKIQNGDRVFQIQLLTL